MNRYDKICGAAEDVLGEVEIKINSLDKRISDYDIQFIDPMCRRIIIDDDYRKSVIDTTDDIKRQSAEIRAGKLWERTLGKLNDTCHISYI